MRLLVLAFAVATGTGSASAAPPAAAAGLSPRLPNRWTATWQSGISQGMQLSLGGYFNRGPAQQNRLTVTRSGLVRTGDSLSFYGWNTTDLRGGFVDFETGVRYRTPLRKVARGTLIGGGGLEHWNFPSVLGGTRDLVVDSYLGWSGGEGVPVAISANGKTLVRSDLPLGTFVCVQALHTQKLWAYKDTRFALQHGPAYVYSYGLYDRNGNRVFRYYGTVTASRGRWAMEVMLRPQLGLQPAIPDTGYWSVSLIRRFGG